MNKRRKATPRPSHKPSRWEAFLPRIAQRDAEARLTFMEDVSRLRLSTSERMAIIVLKVLKAPKIVIAKTMPGTILGPDGNPIGAAR